MTNKRGKNHSASRIMKEMQMQTIMKLDMVMSIVRDVGFGGL